MIRATFILELDGYSRIEITEETPPAVNPTLAETAVDDLVAKAVRRAKAVINA